MFEIENWKFREVLRHFKALKYEIEKTKEKMEEAQDG
jgi:hypothetical protein